MHRGLKYIHVGGKPNMMNGTTTTYIRQRSAKIHTYLESCVSNGRSKVGMSVANKVLRKRYTLCVHGLVLVAAVVVCAYMWTCYSICKNNDQKHQSYITGIQRAHTT